jgi:hAT family C-terminal dimerisation region
LKALAPALDALRDKLRKYYSLTDLLFVYPNAIIFNPRGKLELFKKPNWGRYGAEYNAESYSRRCRSKFVQDYENNEVRSPSPALPPKRPHSAIDDEDEEWEQVLQSVRSKKSANEYDRYISSPLVNYKIPVLEWWRQNESDYPQLRLMVRDTLAVPATGAGVERQFSSSGRIMTSLRRRLSPDTVYEIMMYKNHLVRKRQELKLWKDAGATVAEQEHNLEEGEPPFLKEWKDQWWANRKKCNRV